MVNSQNGSDGKPGKYVDYRISPSECTTAPVPMEASHRTDFQTEAYKEYNRLERRVRNLKKELSAVGTGAYAFRYWAGKLKEANNILEKDN